MSILSIDLTYFEDERAEPEVKLIRGRKESFKPNCFLCPYRDCVATMDGRCPCLSEHYKKRRYDLEQVKAWNLKQRDKKNPNRKRRLKEG